MLRNMRRIAVFALALSLLGCGKPAPKLIPVSGTVTMNGKPLADGVVYFKTIATGEFEEMPIQDGKFSGNALPGERRVEINSYKVTIQGTGEMVGEVKENTISPAYNTNSTLSATVKPEGPNTFEFAVKGK